MRFMQAMVTQAGLALMLAALAWFSRHDRQQMLLALATLLVPLGWTLSFGWAYREDEAARASGRWTKEFDAAQRKKTYAALGGTLALWIALCLLVLALA